MTAVPLGPGFVVWRSCRFIGALTRSLCTLPGGLEWEKCGLTSRPRKTAEVTFIDELLVLFRYPPRSALALLEGTSPLRYCAVMFASGIPTSLLGLPVLSLMVVRRLIWFGLIHVFVLGLLARMMAFVDWVCGNGGGGKRVTFLGSQSRIRVCKKKKRFLVLKNRSMLMPREITCITMPMVHNLHMTRWELFVTQLGHAQAHASRFFA